jgi:hypothetical protein
MESEFESDLIKIKDLVVDLVVKRKFSHKKLKKEIHNAIMEAVKDLQKVSVLYSKSHGGYVYSKQFEECFQNITEDDDGGSYINSRMNHVPLIIEFVDWYISEYDGKESVCIKA